MGLLVPVIFVLLFTGATFVWAYSSQTYDFVLCLANFEQQEIASQLSRQLTHTLQHAESELHLLLQAPALLPNFSAPVGRQYAEAGSGGFEGRTDF